MKQCYVKHMLYCIFGYGKKEKDSTNRNNPCIIKV
jgi:hypothetical protein